MDKLRLERTFKTANANILIMVVLTLVNVIMLIANIQYNFLFSAMLPQVFIVYGKEIATATNISGFNIIGIVFAFLTLGIYLLFYFMTRKKYRWYIALLVVFILDSISIFSLTYTSYFSYVILIAFHAYIIYYIIKGIQAGKALENYIEPPMASENYQQGVNSTFTADNGISDMVEIDTASSDAPLRDAGDKNGLLLINKIYKGLDFTVRRMGVTTQLVVNGKVYSEIKKPFAFKYNFSSKINNMNITVDFKSGFGGASYILSSDGNVIDEAKIFN